MRAGLYVHFPFCRAKCPYCHFASVPHSREKHRAWRAGLEAEASLRADPGLETDTLYIGGGTPSLLSPDEVGDILRLLESRFDVGTGEFTLEANPGAADRARLRGWREAGVTRLSVGVQSFDDAVLRTLGRGYGAAEASAFCSACREAGFEAVGFDLMVGVPGETRGSVERTLERALRLEPDHVSLYFLENVEGLPFEKVLESRPVDEDEVVANHERMRAGLEAAGLARYEISSFARPGKECRHNLKYWRYEPFLGLGPSACSHLGARRWCNKSPIGEWAEALRRGQDPVEENRELDAETAGREALIFGLRLVEGVDLRALEKRFGWDIGGRYEAEIDELVGAGLLLRDGLRLRIPAERMLVSNQAFARFA
ncbi:MAG: radical SAM family heme chaperone HemW [Candidatus Aminicenantes bacterium]